MKKIVVLGPKGTFSDVACQKYMEKIDIDIQYFPSIDTTIGALKYADYALVPIENTLDGYVQQTLDLLFDENAYIIDEIYIPVQFSLIANVKEFSKIKRIYTQFVAKGQCRKFLKTLNTGKLIVTDSNIESFNIVNKGLDGDAAVVPFHMLETFEGFKINAITDSSENYTRFFILSKHRQKIDSDEMKVSIVVNPIFDRPGVLFDILGIFKKYDVNLISIMSRPTKTEMGNYHFYMEMKTKALDQTKIDQALSEIQNNFTIKILGIYPAKN